MSLSQNDRLEQATRWLVRSQDKDFTSENQKMLNNWLKEDPANCEAFEEMGGIWEQVETVEHIFVSEEQSKHTKVFNNHHDAVQFTGLKAWFAKLFGANRQVTFAAATLAILLLLCLPLFKMTFSEQTETLYNYTTATGEQKDIILSDGSILKMNVSSSLSVLMSKGYRQVTMTQGEVFFEVKPDPTRPFEVQTSSSLIRVLGTAFNVKDRRGRVAVDVDHGSVQVKDAPQGSGDMRISAVTLISGQGVDINPSGRLTISRSSNIKHVLAWQNQQVVFRDTPVAEVLQELELYHNVEITLAFQKLGEKGVTGTFDMQKLNQTLEAIATAASLKLEKNTNGTITLSGEPVVKSRL